VDLGLKGKVAMVAGASKGLGFAVARELAREGALVSMTSRDRSSIERAGKEIREEMKTDVLPLSIDVRSLEEIDKWRDKTLKEFGGIDLLFSNSGGPRAGNFASLDDKAWQDALELLVMSAVRLAHGVIPSMKARKGGSILFSTSSSVKEPIENLTLSNVCRVSVVALSKTLSRELAADRIRVNTIIPGRIDTDRVRELDSSNAERAGISVEEQIKQSLSAIPLGRYGKTDEFARAAVFLLSDAASYITGATLQVDGGLIRSVL